MDNPFGSQPSTPSRSPSKAESKALSTNCAGSSYTVVPTDPAAAFGPGSNRLPSACEYTRSSRIVDDIDVDDRHRLQEVDHG
jgi:hypothetical protein